MPDLEAPFVAALAAEREALNARFALRRRGGANIDSAALLEHLRLRCRPLIAAIHGVLPERTRGTLTALYDVSLDLFAASLLGPEKRFPLVERVWSELLPLAPVLLAREPQQVAGCLCNAAFHVASQKGADGDRWMQRLNSVVPRCETAAHLLEAGKVAAWQAGMVQYRGAALDAARRLPPVLAAVALGISAETDKSCVAAVIERLQENPWLTAEVAVSSGSTPAAVAFMRTAGAFVGFGGAFFRPPMVRCEGGRLLASDGQAEWRLFADAYGAWLCKEGPAPARQTAGLSQADASVDRKGVIHWGKRSLARPELATTSSVACDGVTLAVTTATSHHIFLFSQTGAAA